MRRLPGRLARRLPVLLLGAGLVFGVRADAARLTSQAAPRLEGWLPRLGAAAVDTGGLGTVSAEAAARFPFLAGEPADASLSVGSTSHGLVVNAHELRESATLGIVPTHRQRDLHWGTAPLVALLEEVAAELHAKTGTRLWVGNLGRREGGAIDYSVSHHVGRDADLALCYLDRAGRPADPPDLVPLTSEGLSKDRALRFDAARTWLVVKALLTSKTAQAQYVFLAASLRRLLVRHASEHGEPGELLERAAAVVQAVGGGGSHNDHLHLRVYCSEHDVGAGCVDTGVIHPWVKRFDAAREARVALAAERLAASDAGERRRALERLVLLSARDRAGAVALRLCDDEPIVRRSAARALGELGSGSDVGALAERFPAEPELEVKLAILRAMQRLGGPLAASFLERRISRAAASGLEPWAWVGSRAARPSPWLPPVALAGPLLDVLPQAFRGWSALGPAATWRPGDPLPTAAADVERVLAWAAMDAAGRAERLEPVVALVSRLDDPDPVLREAAASALGYVTNRSIGAGWGDPGLSPAVRARYVAAWNRWLERLRGKPRDGWLTAGFVAVGYRVPELHQRNLWELVRALGAPPYLAFNARRALERLTEHQPPDPNLEGLAACRYWLRWLRSHRAQFRLEAPPPAVAQTCPR